MGLCLWGYRYSVYTRIARMVLAVRGLDYDTVEVDPFASAPDPKLAKVTPFNRVPVLEHDGFVVFETSAILRYVAERFSGPTLVPDDPAAAARMEQVIAVVDAYGYRPLVRQVFSHAVFRPLIGVPVDPNEIVKGLKAAEPVLQVLNDIASEGLVLTPGHMTLADLHLAPMIGYFTMAETGANALKTYPALVTWWEAMQQHPAYGTTDPTLATLARDG
jgi:glutathione S-transferase